MKPELTKSQKRIANIILIIAVIFLYKFIKSETATEVIATKKVVTKIDPFFTIQKNETGYYTPDNYLLAYYNNLNLENWDYLLKNTLKQYNLDFIKGHLSNRKVKGVRIVSIVKENKFKAFVTTDITYINVVNDTITKRVKAQLQLSTDYKTWIVAPLTVF